MGEVAQVLRNLEPQPILLSQELLRYIRLVLNTLNNHTSVIAENRSVIPPGFSAQTLSTTQVAFLLTAT